MSPISQPSTLQGIPQNNWEMLISTLSYLLNDIYDKLDQALNLGNQGKIIPLDKGGLGADVSGFNNILAIIGGEAIEITVGTGLNLTNYVLTASIGGNQDWGTAPPSSGSWTMPWIRWNSSPIPGGNIGWTLTAPGVPGTWEPFGEVSY